MPYTVKKALEMETFNTCRLLTGNVGLNNKILWVNILEILDDLSHLEPGELLITTAHGFSNQSEHEQHKIIETIARHELAAVVIQTGHYMKEIPESLINIFKHHKVPLIEMPAGTSFKKLTRPLVKTLLQNEMLEKNFKNGEPLEKQRTSKTENIIPVWNRLIADNNPEMIQQELIDLGILINKPCWVCLLNVYNPDNENNGSPLESEPDLLKQLNQALIQVMRQRHIPFLAGPVDNNLGLLIQPNHSQSSPSNFLPILSRRILEELRLLYPKIEITMGLSKEQKTLLELRKAVHQGFRALQVSSLQLINNHGFTTYSNMGLNRLILEINNLEVLKTVHIETIEPLLAYDKKTGGALLETLRVYLKSMNIRGGAEKLFVHRHTMKYRLNQIREITGINPESAAGFVQFAEGMAIYEYLSKKGLLEK